MTAELINLRAGNTTASISTRGAEPHTWTVAGHDFLWSGDPAHWSYRAPILFPVVGASREGQIHVDGHAYPMPQHGFARTSVFQVMERSGSVARLRLTDTEETRRHYPYAFALEVTVRLEAACLALAFEVENLDERPLPYAVGFHPAFPWPLHMSDRDGHRVVFEEAEDPLVPEIASGGLISTRGRSIPLEGRVLPLRPDLFTEALCFLEARSRWLRFEGPSGAAILMEVEGFPHLAVWSRPTAPFLSLEAWSGYAEPEDFSGELTRRPSIALLPPQGCARHSVRLRAELPMRGRSAS